MSSTAHANEHGSIGFVAIGRPTFDVDRGAALAREATALLGRMGFRVLGSADPALEVDHVVDLSGGWADDPIEALVVFQATFSDSTLAAAAAAATTAPVVLWSAPEPRRGERLQHNSFCGINLAAYALKRAGRHYRWVHHLPSAPGAVDAVSTALAGEAPRAEAQPPIEPSSEARAAARAVADGLRGARIGVIGDHPTGFEPCAYEPESARATFDASIESVPLDELFVAARAATPVQVRTAQAELAERFDLSPIDDLDIEPSTRLLCGFRRLVVEHQWSALATRCWPECFTDFGGAACGPQSILTTDHVPATCEADAYGALTSLILQGLTGEPAFVADIVAIDDDSIVVWHCGLAPHTMASDRPQATTHFARGLPLLGEFALAPGPVTIARVSQSDNRTRMVIGRGELIDAPLPFAGTAGTVRTESTPASVLHTIMSEGLEHHFGIVYGDVSAELIALADLLDLDVVRL